MAESVNPQIAVEAGSKARSRPAAEAPAPVDLREKGRDASGETIALDRRLFMQFLAFTGCGDAGALCRLLESQSPQTVLYRDLNDPRGVGLLAFSEEPAYFLNVVHPLTAQEPFRGLRPRPELTMLGRTYSIGYESDLPETLLWRPVRRVCDPATPWAVWYPLRRDGSFERESGEEQRRMLAEHGGIGHAWGKAGLAVDIRLAAHGLNADNHDFVIGLLGKDLFPLSALVQRMRRTRQTSEFINRMGPFFVGRAVWQPPPQLQG